MSPTAEQLIRDYLNQVSVAARTRLRSDDRRAFLARMRFAIERHCGTPGTADPVEVAKVLASLGDPRKLVDAERARLKAGGDALTAGGNALAAGGGDALAAGGGDAPAAEGDAPAGRTGRPDPRLGRPQGSPQRRRGIPSPWLVSGTGLSSVPGGTAGSVPAPRNPAVSNRPLTGEIKVAGRPITSRWRPGEPLQPRQPKPPRPTRRFRIARGGKTAQDEAENDSRAAAATAGEIRAGETMAGEITAGPGGDLRGPGGAGWPGSSEGDLRGPGGRELRAPDGGDLPGPGGGDLAGSGEGDLPGPGERLAQDLDWIPGMDQPPVVAGPQPGEVKVLPAAMGSQLAAALARLTHGAAALWHGHPLEGTAVALLVLAGLIYSFPIWLLGFLLWIAGVVLALASKIWDTLDKAVGLAAPVVVAVIGTMIALMMGGTHNSVRAYAHEVGTTGPAMFRAAIVFGACYLAWRARRGPRSPNVPPWNRPHRI